MMSGRRPCRDEPALSVGEALDPQPIRVGETTAEAPAPRREMPLETQLAAGSAGARHRRRVLHRMVDVCRRNAVATVVARFEPLAVSTGTLYDRVTVVRSRRLAQSQ